jgi:hypothetical protein
MLWLACGTLQYIMDVNFSVWNQWLSFYGGAIYSGGQVS